MCVMSTVYDHYNRQRIGGWDQKKIDDFKRTIEAAKTVDALTGQPDCVDPEKAKLEERPKDKAWVFPVKPLARSYRNAYHPGGRIVARYRRAK